MKTLLFMIVAVLVLPALADIPPSPIPLHRIGYEILVGITGSVVLGGAALRALIRRCRNSEGDEVAPPFEEDSPPSKGMWMFWPRLAERVEDGGDLRFLSDDEVSEMEHKLEVALPTLRANFEKEYAAKSNDWLKDENCPRAIEHSCWKKERCEELVVTILLQDESLRQRLKGVPVEWLVDCVWKDPTESQVEERARLSSPIDWLREKRGWTSPSAELFDLRKQIDFENRRREEKMRERGRRELRFVGLMVLSYLVEFGLIELGVVDVSSPHVEVKVLYALEMILYPLVFVILFECVMFVFRVVFAEFGCDKNER